MNYSDLNRENVQLDSSLDGITIVNALGDIPGGRTLNTEGFTEPVIKAGHVVIQDKTTKEYKPLGVSGGNYVSLPGNTEYVGVVKASILTKDAQAAIVTMGQVNAASSPYPVTEVIKNGLPRIQFLNL